MGSDHNCEPMELPADPGIIFMGTPDYAVPSLERLVKEGYTIQAVVTQPDRPKGRGRRPVPPPVKQAATGLGLKVLQPERSADPVFCRRIHGLGPDLLVVVAFGQILSQDLLDIPEWGALNIHASLLPRYRGAAPMQWAIMNDEEKTGLSAMRMEAGLDTGPVLLQEEVPIGPEETAGELHGRLAVLSGDLLIRTIEGIRGGRLTPKPQDESRATYAPKIHKGISLIDWNRTARSISALIRGLDPWPGAVGSVKGREVKFFSSKVVHTQRTDLCPGRVARNSKEGLLVETAADLVLIRELQAPGRKRLRAADFLRGFPMDEGTILGKVGLKPGGKGE